MFSILKSTYNDRIRIQNWLFPLGLHYNKKKNTVRTEKINQAYLWMCRQQQDLSKIKSGIPVLNLGYSALVDLPDKRSNSLGEQINKLFHLKEYIYSKYMNYILNRNKRYVGTTISKGRFLENPRGRFHTYFGSTKIILFKFFILAYF